MKKRKPKPISVSEKIELSTLNKEINIIHNLFHLYKIEIRTYKAYCLIRYLNHICSYDFIDMALFQYLGYEDWNNYRYFLRDCQDLQEKYFG